MSPILPGSSIGVLGSGQLGRMFAIAARRMGYRVHTLSPEDDTPTGQVADVEINAQYDDLAAVTKFASNVSVVTFEFENVPAATAAACERSAPVRPAGAVLHVTQHRIREKSFLREHGFPTTDFATIRTRDDLLAAVMKIGTPSILKTAGWGYDGKGQVRIHAPGDAEHAWKQIDQQEAILEAMVDFDCEVSVVAARGQDGHFSHFGVIRNDHANHILDVSMYPSRIDPRLEKEAIEIARGVLAALNVVGILCVELFVTKSGKILVNELAPRPHNSGHLTFDACVTSQFEQQLRAICHLPLGSTEYTRPAAMANLLGDLWQNGEPNWNAALQIPNVKLHLYGKQKPKPGRKMGHLTALAETPEQARDAVIEARRRLQSR